LTYEEEKMEQQPNFIVRALTRLTQGKVWRYGPELQALTTGGWFRGLNVRGEFAGWVWKCPGSIQGAMAAVHKDAKLRDAGGNPVHEVPVTREIGCAFQSSPIQAGMTGLSEVKARCPQCGNSSELLVWLRQRGIKASELEASVPALALAGASTFQSRAKDSWGDATGDYGYERSNPEGLF
jgi:hypothetical protein